MDSEKPKIEDASVPAEEAETDDGSDGSNNGQKYADLASSPVLRALEEQAQEEASVPAEEAETDDGSDGSNNAQTYADRSPVMTSSLVLHASKEQAQKDFPLSNNIWINLSKPIMKLARIYHGEQKNEITGSRPIAVQFMEFEDMLVKKAKTLTKLASHPNILSIITADVYYSGLLKYIYIATELFHEDNLNDFIQKMKNEDVSFDSVRMKQLAKQLLEGLSFIHSKDIIHGNLHPRNILFNVNQQILKISEFGFSSESKCVQEKIGAFRFALDGYRSPETYNDNVISKQSDIFSLGLVIYNMWALEHPFGKDHDLWVPNIKKNKNMDLSKLKTGEKVEAERLIKQMMSFDPKKRPTTSQILADVVFSNQDVQAYRRTGRTDLPSASASVDSGWHSTGEGKPSTHVHVGKRIYFDQSEPLRENYRVFKGSNGDQPVAVKILEEKVGSSREISLFCELSSHKNIVKYIDSGKFDYRGLPSRYVAMDLCQRKTLSDVIQQDWTSFGYRRCILYQVASAIEHMHSGKKKLLHRDIKPSNILFALDGSQIKVADFGLAKEQPEGELFAIKSMEVIGTFGWGSPESYSGRKMTTESDIFSLGLVFYYVLTGGRHVYGEDQRKWMVNIQNEENKSFDDLKCIDSGLAKDLVSNMVQHTPGVRPSATDVLAHPFFWNEGEKLSLLKSIWEESESEQSLREKIDSVLKDDWMARMDLSDYEKAGYPKIPDKKVLIDFLNGPEVDYPKTTSGLLKFIKDVPRLAEEDASMQELFKDERSIWEFFSIRFPSLLLDLIQLVGDNPHCCSPELQGQLKRRADPSFYEDLQIQDTPDTSEHTGSLPSLNYRTGEYPSYSPWSSNPSKG